MITLRYETQYILPHYLILEERYNKKYYEEHPEYDWDTAWDTEQFNDFINAEDSPYKLDSEWKIARPYNEILSDNLLDHYHTDIYAMIPPNYLPMYMHWHTYFEIAYILEGTCVNYSGNQKLILKEGDMLILAPNTAHAISAFSDECRMINVMIRSSAFTDTFFNQFNQEDILYSFFQNVLFQYKTNTYILFQTQMDSIIKNVLFILPEEILPYHRHQTEVRTSALSLIFSRLMDQHASGAIIFSDDDTHKVHAIALILSYIQQHYCNLSLKQLSNFFGYSERHMTRILKKYTGKNYQEHVIGLKMRSAANLLKNGNKTIDEIADTLGFSTTYSFRKCFKAYYSITPGEYRKRYLPE